MEQAHAQMTNPKFATISEVNIKDNILDKIDVNIKEEFIDNVWQENVNLLDDDTTGSIKSERNPLEFVETKKKNLEDSEEEYDERDTEFKEETSEAEATDDEGKTICQILC